MHADMQCAWAGYKSAAHAQQIYLNAVVMIHMQCFTCGACCWAPHQHSKLKLRDKPRRRNWIQQLLCADGTMLASVWACFPGTLPIQESGRCKLKQVCPWLVQMLQQQQQPGQLVVSNGASAGSTTCGLHNTVCEVMVGKNYELVCVITG